MPLRFDPSSYLQALEYGREQRPDPSTITEPLMQGLQLMLQNKQINQQSERQKMMDQFLMAKEGREQQESEVNFGRPISPDAMYGESTGMTARSSMMPGARTLPKGVQGPSMPGQAQIGRGTGLRDAFQKWRAGAMQGPAQPGFVEALPRDDRKIFLEAQNLPPKGQVSPEMAEADMELKKARAEYLRRNPQQKENFNQENNLRSQFLNQSKDFSDTASSYQRMIDSSREPSAAGDLALIFNYMKMLDPGSTVREGEFANAAASGSYGARFQAAANKILSGERLDDSMRQDFMGRATDLYQGQLSRHKQREGEFQNLATQYGGQPSRVTPNLATPIGGYGQSDSTDGQAMTRTIRNKLTGETRKQVSNDGGRTWN